MDRDPPPTANLSPQRYRFRPSDRIKKRSDFIYIQTSGKRARTQHFLMLYLSPRSQQLHSRIGITVTVKVNKKAAYRNKLKRRIRENFRKFHPKFSRHADMVIIAFLGAAELDFVTVRSELLSLWSRAGILPQRSGNSELPSHPLKTKRGKIN